VFVLQQLVFHIAALLHTPELSCPSACSYIIYILPLLLNCFGDPLPQVGQLTMLGRCVVNDHGSCDGVGAVNDWLLHPRWSRLPKPCTTHPVPPHPWPPTCAGARCY
jgi:hypothetical protein